jgi:peptide/nickel transport system permease protein
MPRRRSSVRGAMGGAGGLATSVALLVLASFSIVRLIPGDPARALAGPQAPESTVLAIRGRLGLDDSLLQQLLDYLGRLPRMDFGRSFQLDEPVSRVLVERAPTTLKLVAVALALVLLVSVPLGLLLAAHTQGGRRAPLEVGATALSGLFAATPEYVSGTLLVAVFGVGLAVLPVAGSDGVQSLVLPAVALATAPTAVLTRIVRVEALAVLQQDYVRTARLKGISTSRLYGVHVLPNLVPTALTLGGLVLVGMIGGTIVIENVFAYPGLGTALMEAVIAHDYPVVQGIVVVLGLGVLALNTILSLAVRTIDPRIERA